MLMTWELGNTGNPTMLMTWEPGNTGTPIILNICERGNTGTPAIWDICEPENIGKPIILILENLEILKSSLLSMKLASGLFFFPENDNP